MQNWNDLPLAAHEAIDMQAAVNGEIATYVARDPYEPTVRISLGTSYNDLSIEAAQHLLSALSQTIQEAREIRSEHEMAEELRAQATRLDSHPRGMSAADAHAWADALDAGERR